MAVEESEPGIRRCNACRWLFVSDDVMRIRRCRRCHAKERKEPSVSSVRFEGSDPLLQEAKNERF